MPAATKDKGLTDREAAFVVEYLKDKSKTQAAVRAGYSARAAANIGSEVFARPRVKAAIRAALVEQARRTLIDADQVLLDIQQGGNDARKAGEFGHFLRSRELLGKHFGLFTEKHELTGKDGGPVQTESTVQFYLPANGRDG